MENDLASHFGIEVLGVDDLAAASRPISRTAKMATLSDADFSVRQPSIGV